jgi:hypothetical protein
LKEVVAESHSVGGLSHAMIQRARNIVRNQNDTESNKSYTTIPSLCHEIMKYNPGTRICCQLDSQGRFYRFFMLLPSSIDALDSCLPCLEVAGTFMKHPSYNGVCILVISKNGDHKNIPIAITMVPFETTDNYIWMFLNMKASGIPFDNLAVFSNRGKQMNAAKRLYKFGCNWLHIKNCTNHIAKNVCSWYSNKDFKLKNMIFGLQSSVSMIEYIKTLIERTKKYGEFIVGVCIKYETRV